MKKVNHINILDNVGRVYCYKLNKVKRLKDCPCSSCTKFNGTAQGSGVECLWEDKNTDYLAYTIYDPYLEFARLNNNT